jgi:flagellin
MGLRINQNIAAMNAYRNLSVTDGQMSKSLEKLSSGFRINRAADDAAGLSISEGLRSQVSGLKVAVRNAQDGISVVQTAEGALTETTAILQRMRDLAVQAANGGSQDATAQAAAQTEFGQLQVELDRIAKTTSFGGQKLLDVGVNGADGYDGTFQVGANNTVDEQIGINLDQSLFSGQNVATKSSFKVDDSIGAGSKVDIAVNGTTMASVTLGGNDDTVAEQVTALNDDATFATYFEASNDGGKLKITSLETGAAGGALSVARNGAEVAGTKTAGSGTTSVDASAILATGANLNGSTVTFTLGGTSYTTGALAAAANNNGNSIASALQTAMRAASGSTTLTVTNNAGVMEFASGDENVVDITAGADGAGTLNIFSDTTAHAEETGDSTVVTGTLVAGNTVKITTDGGEEVNVTLGANDDLVSEQLVALNADAAFSAKYLAADDGTGKIEITSRNKIGTTDGVVVNQSTPDDDKSGTVTMGSATGFDSDGLGLTSGSVKLDTTANAQAAIALIDSAIKNVSTARATMGAFQNRFEHTINNLNVAVENLSASESRIRDTDMAAEMVSFTRAQILSNAGTSMLAQANQAPQSVLQLLR